MLDKYKNYWYDYSLLAVYRILLRYVLYTLSMTATFRGNSFFLGYNISHYSRESEFSCMSYQKAEDIWNYFWSGKSKCIGLEEEMLYF